MSEDGLRVDIWLWRARFFKTRAEANRHVSDKGVRIDRSGMVRKSNKPGATILPDDVLIFRKAGRIEIIRVLGLPDRRGPASEAQGFYQRIDEGDPLT